MTLMKRIIIILWLLTAAAGFAEDNQAGPQVIMRSTQDHLTAGSSWTLTMLIAHHEPGEVEVRAPHFSGFLFLDQITKGPRFIHTATGQVYLNQPGESSPTAFERWTAMEYRFTLNRAGLITFDAFTVITPNGQTKTAPFDLNVQPPRGSGAAVRTYRLVWEDAPSALAVGQDAVFTLRINNGNSSGAAAETEWFVPPVPPGYILESLPLTHEEQAAGMALKLRLIPLEARPFVLEQRRLARGGAVFEIPALRIPVNRAAPQNTPPAETVVEADNPPLPFPAPAAAQNAQGNLYHKYRAECDALYAAARDVWEQGHPAGALAALRKNERDHPAGAFFAVIRREAEYALGITGTREESPPSFAAKLQSLLGKKTRLAVVRETVVRRIPDMAGEEIAIFKEGQPVRIPGTSAAVRIWRLVITNDDAEISGWIPEQHIIFY